MGVIELPSGFWSLKGDSCLTAKALAGDGDITIEKYIRDLPAVRRLGPGSVVCDAGAFVGDTARIFLDLGCEVWAFEPYPDAFACLEHNCPSAVNIREAVGDGRPLEPAGAFGCEGSNYGTRMVSPGDVPSLRIDDLNFNRLDFLKIDVEGMEPAVLDGASETITRCRPTVLVEVFGALLEKQGFSEEMLIRKLAGMGYSLTEIGKDGVGKYDVLGVMR